MASHYRDFMGAKLALFVGDRLLMLHRDDKPGLLWPGFWDLPGGGREGDETPAECITRELKEEFALRLPVSQIHWARAYTNSIGRTVWFFAGALPETAVRQIRFGSEGQGWDRFSVDAFLNHPKVVPQFKMRLRDYLGGASQDHLS